MKKKFMSNLAKILATSFLFTIFFNNISLSTVDVIAEKAGDVTLQGNTQGDSVILQNSSSVKDSIEYEYEGAKSAGIRNLSGTYTLDTKYHEPNKFIIYYGELASSGISDYSVYDFMVVHDRNYESIHKARSQGCNIFQYISFGGGFRDTDSFISDFKSQIAELKNKGLADGIFIDECDVACWGAEYPNQPDKCQKFYNRLKDVTDYCKAMGLKTVINGTSAFCELGDYYLWESFQGYWSTNSLLWSNANAGITKLSNGAVTYKQPLSEWKASGSCCIDGTGIRGGSNGAVEMVVDMDKVLEPSDRKQVYDWVYLQWIGNNVPEDKCSIWVWTGDSLPFDEAAWSKLPKLWKGKEKSWNGIGKTAKYIKIKIEFKGVSDLKIDSIALNYNYSYPSWNMASTNVDAETNPFVWNYNNTQRNYLWKKMNESGNKIKVLTHTYGSEEDSNRKMFSKLSSEIWGYHSFDYVNPSMQNIYDTDELDNPIGMLLKREGDNTGYFTGATAAIDISSQKYSLTRSERDYWYKRAVTVDGMAGDWSSGDILYQNNQKGLSSYPQNWSACVQTFSQGSFDNVKVAKKFDGESVLELIKDGTGTWISHVIGSGQDNPVSTMEQVLWNGDGEGTVSYSVKYKSKAGEWSDWIEISKGGIAALSYDFVAFQVKVVLSGKASYNEHNMKRDKDDKTISDDDIYHQGINFWGSSHRWKAYLSDDIKVNKLSVTDDSKYIYFSFAVDGAIDFSNSTVPGNLYEIYLNTTGVDEQGFTGSWWTLPFGADYKISNNSIYKWNDSYSKEDFKGWTWIGAPRMTYKLSSDRKLIEYRIAKDSLGGLESKSVKMYMYAEEAKTKTWNFIKPLESGSSTSVKEYFSYNQKSYKQNAPHGWFKSDEIDISNKKDVGITWEQSIPSATGLKAWIRTKQKYYNWSDWQEVTNGKMIQGNYEKAQYCFGLYTNSGGVTPTVKNIKYVFGSSIY